MAVLCQSFGRLDRDGSFLNPAQDFTRSLWAQYQEAAVTDYFTAWILKDAGYNDWLYLGTFGAADLRNLGQVGAGGVNALNLFTASSAVIGTWVYLTLRYTAATTTVDLLVNGVVIASGTYDLSTLIALTDESLGSDDFGGGTDIAVAYERVWQAALSDSEIGVEMQSESAVRTADLLADSPLPDTSHLQDDSGNGHDWSAVGDIADTDGPLPLVPSGALCAYLECSGDCLPITD